MNRNGRWGHDCSTCNGLRASISSSSGSSISCSGSRVGCSCSLGERGTRGSSSSSNMPQVAVIIAVTTAAASSSSSSSSSEKKKKTAAAAAVFGRHVFHYCHDCFCVVGLDLSEGCGQGRAQRAGGEWRGGCSPPEPGQHSRQAS